MPSPRRLTLPPMLFASALAASACSTPQAVIQPLFPPSADLRVEAKPIPPDNIVTSAQAAAEYDIALEAWGERGWLAVARLCRWAIANGVNNANANNANGGARLTCPSP